MRRKFLSVVLCVCMMLTMAPFAFAAGTDTGSNTEEAGTSIPANSSSGAGGGAGSVSTSTTNAITNEADLRTALESANDEDTITISGTISIDAPLVITKTVTLTGGSITASDSFTANSNKLADMSLISLKTAGKVLTLKDITLDAKKKTLVVFSNAGKVVVDGATITGGKTNSSVAGVYMTNASEFEMTSGSIRSNEVGKTDYSKYAADLWVGANAKATLSGGNIDNIFVNANSFSENNPGYFKMQDGHVTNLYAEYYENYGATVIYDGGTLDNLYISTTASNGACENVTPVAGMTYKGGQTDAAALTPVAKVDAKKFTSLADAIATADNKTVILLKDVTEDVVIPSDKTVTLNLNGKKLTNVSSNTITNNGTLTITGEGTVDNVTHAKAAVWNNVGGTVIIDGGAYTRSAEASTNATNSGNNSYYVIDNYGTLTINKGTFKFSDTNAGAFSSLIHNGWYDGRKNTSERNAVMTINDGNFTQGTGGKITVKNDDYGELEIKGGVFTQPQSNYYCVYNYNIAKISGGTINGYVGNEYASTTTYDKGLLEISNEAVINGDIQSGTAASQESSSEKNLIKITGNAKVAGAITSADAKYVTVSGGYFTSDPTAYLATGKGLVDSDLAGYYKVGDSTVDVDTEVKAGAPSVSIPTNSGLTEDDVKSAATSQATQASLAKAASSLTSNSSVVGTKKEAKEKLGSIAGEDATITVVVQPYLDVKVTEVNNNAATMSVNISALYNVIATTNPDNIILTGTDVNAVNLKTAQHMSVSKPVTIKLPLPSNFGTAGDKLSIKHTKENGSIEYYTGTVTKEGTDPNTKTYVTFTTNGFSPFVIYAASANVASIGDNVYPSLQAAIDAVQDNQTITLLKDTDENVTVSKAVKFTLAGTDHLKGTISAGSRYNLTKNGNTYTVTRQSSSSSGSTSTTYNVNVNAATNGAVAADKKTASKGTTVTVTASPSKGYVVDAVKVVDKDGKDVAVTEKDGKYVFTMPASAVTVTGSFKAETPAPVALPFTDVKSGNWFYDAVKYAYEQGLMTGTSATTFAPNGTMNRAMIVTVLYRLEKSPAVTGASKFTDVPAGQWYSDAVAWAAANKIVNGYDQTTFGPMNAVTREQMAAILFRYEQVKGLENVTLEENLNRFPDQNKISAYAIPALQWAVGQKIINGNADGTLDPTGTATRAQVAQIFTNLLNQ